jgi:putative ABC transport system permease protein
MIANSFNDARYALRRLIGTPGFSVASIGMLALGIGFSVTMFCTLYGVLLRGLPFPHADRLVLLEARSAAQHVEAAQLTAAEAERLADGTPGFDALAFYVYWSETVDEQNAHPRDLTTQKVSARFFDVLGLAPLLGRTFSVDEVREDRPVVVLSYAEWQRSFGGDPAVIGQRVHLAGRAPLEVIGVMPRDIEVFVGDVALWRPYAPATLQQDTVRRLNQRFMRVVGRLQEGVSAQQADAALAAQSAVLRDANGATQISDWQLRQRPLMELLVADVRVALWGAFAMAVLVLLIAAANVAILLDGRQAARRHEHAVMQAIGADAARIRRGVVLELLALALVAALLGVAFAHFGIGMLRELARDSVPRVDEIGMDASVIAFALLLGIVAPLAAGLSGALRVQGAPHEAIRAGGKGLIGGHAARRALPAIAMALSTMSLVAALSFAAALWKLQQVAPGFRADGVHALQLFRSGAPGPGALFATQLQERLGALPGARAVAVTSVAPLSQIGQATMDLRVVGRAENEPQQVMFRRASPGYRALLDIALLSGRDFGDTDRNGSEPVAIINRSAAQRIFGDASPLGEQISLPLQRDQRVACRIVGVVDDIRNDGLRAPPQPEVLVPFAQFPSVAMTFLVRSDGALSGLDAQMADALWSVDAHQSITRQFSLADDLAQETRPARFFARTVGAFALAALLLAVLGVYAVASLQQQRRASEFGLRLAVGAPPGRLAIAVLRDSFGASAVGVALGLGGAWLLLRLLQAQLFGIDTAAQPLLLALGLGAMALAALLAALLPALRAARVDPISALRAE